MVCGKGPAQEASPLLLQLYGQARTAITALLLFVYQTPGKSHPADQKRATPITTSPIASRIAYRM
jgi:hypothetical protein